MEQNKGTRHYLVHSNPILVRDIPSYPNSCTCKIWRT